MGYTDWHCDVAQCNGAIRFTSFLSKCSVEVGVIASCRARTDSARHIELKAGNVIYVEGTTWMFKIKSIEENETKINVKVTTDEVNNISYMFLTGILDNGYVLSSQSIPTNYVVLLLTFVAYNIIEVIF